MCVHTYSFISLTNLDVLTSITHQSLYVTYLGINADHLPVSLILEEQSRQTVRYHLNTDTARQKTNTE